MKLSVNAFSFMLDQCKLLELWIYTAVYVEILITPLCSLGY